MGKIKNAKGITLVALIITIIVMLILVAITFNMAVNGDLFTYAGRAAGDTKRDIEIEQKIAGGKVPIDDGWYDSAEDYLANKEAFSNPYTETKNYTDENGDTAVIPKGFEVAVTDGANTVDDGLVIQDKVGNQFVWIPVDNVTSLAEFQALRKQIDNLSNYIEPDSDSQDEYNAIVASVIRNKGFYLGRCAVGSETIRTESNATDGPATPLVKRCLYPYTFVNWETAKTSSQSMYNSSQYGVKSTLCYGVQWDATLRFIGKIDETNSTSWGNYANAAIPSFIGEYNKFDIISATVVYNDIWLSDKTSKAVDESLLLQTGASERNKAKNIYDLAGNTWEWTMEGYSGGGRIIRGSNYAEYGTARPVSARSTGVNITTATRMVGYRVALYITN